MRALIVALAMLPGLAFAQFPVPGVRVNIAPPPVRVEVRPVAPSPGHVWLGGHWAWRGGRHVWLPGTWAMPPAPGYRWVEARWVNQGGQWVFFEGHWMAPEQPVVVQQPVPVAPQPEVVVEEAPPAPIVEAQPPVPYAGAVWMPGHWWWHGRHHTWIAGHYERGQPGRAWHRAEWVRTPNGRWRYVPGYWQ